jgi:hypothetical protein
MLRRIFTFISVCSLVALVVTLVVWPMSYRTSAGHIWRTNTFLLEGKENVDSMFGITASRGVLRVEVFATREPAKQPSDDYDASRLQTTRITVPLWGVAIVLCILPILFVRRRIKRGYDADLN